MIKLTLDKILEFYDVPQLFVARDTMDTNYLCVLYRKERGFEYLAVQISNIRLHTFLCGDLDLRKAYENPEQDNSLYHVLVEKEQILADRLLQPNEITADMLPEAGYYFDAEDAIEDSNTDTLQINIPSSDRSFLADMATRMGWTASTLRKASRNIAVL